MFQVEEVAEEELHLLQRRRFSQESNRETRSNTKGDTRVTFIPSNKGGKLHSYLAIKEVSVGWFLLGSFSRCQVLLISSLITN